MELFGHWYSTLLVLMVGLPRLAAFFSVMPVLAPGIIPPLTRNAVCFSLVLFLLPPIRHTAPQNVQVLPVALLVVKESGLGFLLGWFGGLVFWAITEAGDIVARSIGGSEATIMDTAGNPHTTVLGSMLYQTLVTVFFVKGGMLLLAGALFETYRIWPVFSYTPVFSESFLPLLVRSFTHYFGAMLLLAAPALAAMFLVTIGLALINRFAPTLNVFILSMPLKSMVAIFVLALSLSVILVSFENGYSRIPSIVRTLMPVLRN